MILVLDKKASKKDINKMSAEFDGYIKVVVDIKKGILAGGAERHYDLEQMLLQEGSYQKNLWGGGIDIDTKDIDYNSMINLRVKDNNPSRDILSLDIRLKFDKIIKDILIL